VSDRRLRRGAAPRRRRAAPRRAGTGLALAERTLMADDIRGWLADALGRRSRQPQLEQTIYRQLRALEHGPLEQIGVLVRAVVEELQLAQRRLNDQAADLRLLHETVTRLSARVDDLSAQVGGRRPPAPTAHVVLLPTDAGYVLLRRDGPPPAPGSLVEH